MHWAYQICRTSHSFLMMAGSPCFPFKALLIVSGSHWKYAASLFCVGTSIESTDSPLSLQNGALSVRHTLYHFALCKLDDSSARWAAILWDSAPTGRV
jgi:hypothetical protein